MTQNVDVNSISQEVTESKSATINVRELELLYSVCSDILISGDGQAFQQIAEVVLNHLGGDCCSIWEVNSDQAREPIRLGFARSSKYLNHEMLPSLDFEVSSIVATSGEPLVSMQISKDPRIPQSGYIVPLKVLALPLMKAKEKIGAFSIWTEVDQDRPIMTTTEIELLATIGQILSLGLDNFRQLPQNHHNQRLKKELEIARDIQQGMAPRNMPDIPGISIETRTVAANQVGGDYVDILQTQGGKIGLVIGDVMGKGVPAALFMVMTRAVFRTVAKGNLLPHQVLREVNEVLLKDLTSQGSFVTLFYALYDPVTCELLYANAGHNPPLVYRMNKDEFYFLKSKGIYIGGKKNANYDLKSCRLQPDDIVIFYSDGLKEARNKQNEQFGLKRIMETVKRYAVYNAAGIMDCLSYALAEFTGDSPQSDDVTIAILKLQ
ncbi:MAG: GAF domain-containing SpoIIE family protein phosphatase [Carboxydocellales bacterium]